MNFQTLTIKKRVLWGFQYLENYFITFALAILFFIQFFKELIFSPFELKETWYQSYILGFKSVTLVGITGFIMGAVLTIQSRPTLAEFGAESWLPAMVSVSVVREIGPVITALICAGKIGSGIGAELASMRVTEQIDAMEVSGINPFNYLVVTRVLSCIFMIPILTIYSDAFALFGSFIGVNINEDVSFSLYFTQAISELEYADLFPAFIKTFFFGLVIGLVSCFHGYNATNGTTGVGKAANAAVVYSSLLIFVLDAFALKLNDLFTS